MMIPTSSTSSSFQFTSCSSFFDKNICCSELSLMPQDTSPHVSNPSHLDPSIRERLSFLFKSHCNRNALSSHSLVMRRRSGFGLSFDKCKERVISLIKQNNAILIASMKSFTKSEMCYFTLKGPLDEVNEILEIIADANLPILLDFRSNLVPIFTDDGNTFVEDNDWERYGRELGGDSFSFFRRRKSNGINLSEGILFFKNFPHKLVHLKNGRISEDFTTSISPSFKEKCSHCLLRGHRSNQCSFPKDKLKDLWEAARSWTGSRKLIPKIFEEKVSSLLPMKKQPLLLNESESEEEFSTPTDSQSNPQHINAELPSAPSNAWKTVSKNRRRKGKGATKTRTINTLSTPKKGKKRQMDISPSSLSTVCRTRQRSLSVDADSNPSGKQLKIVNAYELHKHDIKKLHKTIEEIEGKSLKASERRNIVDTAFFLVKKSKPNVCPSRSKGDSGFC